MLTTPVTHLSAPVPAPLALALHPQTSPSSDLASADAHEPPAGDGRPPWTAGSFKPPAYDHDSPVRSRRFVIANLIPPEFLMLHQAGVDLLRIGEALWRARMGGPRSGLLVALRRKHLRALGGVHTWQGREFLRRLRSINRLAVHLARVQREQLQRLRAEEGDFDRLGWEAIVRDEIEKARRAGMIAMAHEGLREGPSAAELQRRINCRIRLQQSCLPWFLQWLIGHFRC
ncbi:hypothetical protein [Xylophilus sp. GOD-11R]|uniref:hypothetical protein n=1 Tax=Xylophilus sp. GOD-11R TaxID=3089814 RepID=UPI00298D2851|nr:hypothetical protein [Xylophilus sp. GOD-11R]WPB56891.1 hypothetical protein R9X41_22610 [Xylophilus sp. GOD-11R]